MGIFILISIFIIIIYFLFSLSCVIIGHFLNFIDDIFGITARRNKKKEPELLSDIGISN